MKYSASLLALASWATALTQQCHGPATKDSLGNSFCGEVDQIVYQNVPSSGSYKAVTGMGDDGSCSFEDKTYSSPLGPFSEELSMHFRGPLRLKEFAVYTLASDNKKREASETSPHVHARRHGHQHFHAQRKAKRADMVVATIDGKVVSWENNYFGDAPTAPAAAPAADPTSASNNEPAPPAPTSGNSGNSNKKNSNNKESSSSKKTSSSKSKSASTTGGDWERTSYYNAKSQVVDNLVFLGNHGSGTTWGSLSYLSSTGTGGAKSAQTLEDVFVDSNQEFSIFTAEKCGSDCGYARNKDVAYKGFGGGTQIFLFHFQMPSGSTSTPLNPDMPAIWALNARIPRTEQYGDCSCWKSGCGELDIYEVLTKSATKCKSTIHLEQYTGGGSSDYFKRPTDAPIRVAAVLDERNSHIAITRLSDDFDFNEGLTDKTVQGWLDAEEPKSSLFQLSV